MSTAYRPGVEPGFGDDGPEGVGDEGVDGVGLEGVGDDGGFGF